MYPILNHLIAQHPETRRALTAHGGRRFELAAAGWRLCAVISAEGYLAAAQGAPETVLCFRNSAVQKVLQGQTPGVDDIEVAGDHALGMALLPLIGGLRYHAAQDIRRLFGETAAEQAQAAGRQIRSDWADVKQGMFDSVSDYVRRHDDTVAVHRDTFAPFAEAVETLRDDAARLEARLKRLAR